MSEHVAEKNAGRAVRRITDPGEYLAAVRELEDRAPDGPFGASTTALCCCHGFDEPCGHGFDDEHVHKCLPRALDLGGHCPDNGCPGQCWTRATSPGDRT